MEEKLKPCPFCGGEAKITLFMGRSSIACKECYAAMIPGYCEDIIVVVKHWNRREEAEKVWCKACLSRN